MNRDIHPGIALIAVVILAIVVFAAYYVSTGVFFRAPKVPPGGFKRQNIPMPPVTKPTNIQHGPIGH